MTLALLILGIVLFVGLVVVHEWGHFIAARRSGVEVEEFGIGFPPALWKKRIKSDKGDFNLSINLLPLGGFVRLKGEHDSADAKGSFGAAPLGAKVKIMVAGVLMNLFVAYVLFVILALVGIPKIIENQFTVPSDTKVVQEVDNEGQVVVGEVMESSPAERAGIKEGDRIVSVAGTAITSPETVGEVTKQHAGQTVPVVVDREGQLNTYQVQLNKENDGSGYLGVASQSNQRGLQIERSTWSAPIVAAGLTKQITELTLKGLGGALVNLFKGDTQKASENVAGPVGIAVILKEGSKLGINFILMFVAVISLTLAIINILPIPALDGGRLFVTLLFRALNKPLTRRMEELIHGTGFVALITLLILITVVDIKRFF